MEDKRSMSATNKGRSLMNKIIGNTIAGILIFGLTIYFLIKSMMGLYDIVLEDVSSFNQIATFLRLFMFLYFTHLSIKFAKHLRNEKTKTP